MNLLKLLLICLLSISLKVENFGKKSTLNSIQNFLLVLNENLKEHNLPQFPTTNFEFCCPVINLDNDEQLLYIDLESNNGYLLINKSNDVIDFSFNGDFSFIRNTDSIIYYQYKTFFVFTDEALIPIRDDTQNYENIFIGDEALSQLTATFGVVHNDEIEEYIAYKYPFGTYSIGLNDRLDNLPTNSTGYLQGNETVFLRDENGHTYTEGNCPIISTANVLSYYSQYGGKTDLPSSSATMNVSVAYYQQFMESGFYPKHTPTVNIHTLAFAVWQNAILNGYYGRGMDDTGTSAAFIGAVEDFNYQGFFTPMSSIVVYDIVTDIANNHPIQLRTVEDVVYDGHGMMITGYAIYSYTLNFGISGSITFSIFFVSIFDGHNTGECWFDIQSLTNAPTDYRKRASSVSVAKLRVL